MVASLWILHVFSCKWDCVSPMVSKKTNWRKYTIVGLVTIYYVSEFGRSMFVKMFQIDVMFVDSLVSNPYLQSIITVLSTTIVWPDTREIITWSVYCMGTLTRHLWSLHGLLNFEIDWLACHVITTEYEACVHCIHM